MNQKIKSLSGKIVESIFKKTDCVIVGDDFDRKQDKATAREVVILNEQKLLQLMK